MADREAATRAVVLPGSPPSNGHPKLGVLLAILDFPLLVAGYRAVINAAPDLHVVGIVEGRETMLEEVARSSADLVVTDGVPGPSAAGASTPTIEEIRAVRPAARILALDSRCDRDADEAVDAAAADGVLTREATPVDVLRALRGVLQVTEP